MHIDIPILCQPNTLENISYSRSKEEIGRATQNVNVEGKVTSGVSKNNQ